MSACPIDNLGVSAPTGGLTATFGIGKCSPGEHGNGCGCVSSAEGVRSPGVRRADRVPPGRSRSGRKQHRGVQEQIYTCRAGFVTKKAQPAPFDVPDSVRMGRRIGDSLPKDGNAQDDSPQIAWSFTRETSRSCQFDTFDTLTLPKNVTERRIHARDRRPLTGPTDSQQGAAKAESQLFKLKSSTNLAARTETRTEFPTTPRKKGKGAERTFWRQRDRRPRMPSFARKTWRAGRGRSKGATKSLASLDPLAPLDAATANYGGP